MSSKAIVDELIKSLGNQLVGNESKNFFKNFMEMKMNEEYKILVDAWATCNESVTFITNDAEDLLSDEIEDSILTEAKKVLEKVNNSGNLHIHEVNQLKQAINNRDTDKTTKMIVKLRNTIQGIFIEDFNEFQIM